jgi:transcription antitermination factor NusG
MTSATSTSEQGSRPGTGQTGPPFWHALWTHSHCEQVVHDQLAHKGVQTFLPKVDVWSRRRGVRHLVSAPMFPGYLFFRHAIDKTSYGDVVRTRGVVRVLGERWDRPAEIPQEEIAAIVQVVTERHPVLPYPYLKEGQRVRVASGSLAGVEGVLVRAKPDKGLLVLSVHLLQRSVAVSIDATAVTPA